MTNRTLYTERGVGDFVGHRGRRILRFLGGRHRRQHADSVVVHVDLDFGVHLSDVGQQVGVSRRFVDFVCFC